MIASDVEAIVNNELKTLTDDRVRTHINSLLVTPPRRIKVGRPKFSGVQLLEGFLILNHPKSGLGIGYCREAFGPERAWGLEDTKGELFWAGISDCWFPRLLDAYFDSPAATELPIWRVREWQSDYMGAWLSEELSWDEAWARTTELRAIPQHFRCYHYHSIEY